MSSSFDPYHKWLGISPKDQPPNHYRLLAIDLFESDLDVIDSAADQRMSHVRAYQTGKHSGLSQQLLNEIAAARICLLNTAKKEEYDRQLSAQLEVESLESDTATESTESPAFPPIPPAVPPLDEDVPPRFEGVLPHRWPHRRRLSWQAMAAGVVLVVLLGGVFAAIFSGGDSDVSAPDVPKIGQTGGAANVTSPDQVGGGGAEKQPLEGAADSPSSQDTVSEPEDVTVLVIGEGQEQSTDPEPPVERLPVPDVDARLAAEKQLQPILAGGGSAQELLSAALAENRSPEERFVLLEKTRFSATASGDVKSALAVMEETDRRYQIDVLQMRVDAFIALENSVTSPEAIRAVVEFGITLLDDLVAGGRPELALGIPNPILRLARKCNDDDLSKRATMAVITLDIK